MNDPDRRHMSDGFDSDAIFADIVAHINDDEAGPERRVRPSAEDGATDHEATDQTTDHEATDQTTGHEAADHEAADHEATDHEAADHEAADQTTGHEAADHEATDQTTHDATDQPRGDESRSPIIGPAVLPAPDDQAAVPTPQVWRAHEVDHDYEEHFEPPPTAPLPVGDLQFWGIIAGMGGGPLLLLYLVFFNRDASSYWLLTAIAMSVGGFALLVQRLPRQREDDDDGARL